MKKFIYSLAITAGIGLGYFMNVQNSNASIPISMGAFFSNSVKISKDAYHYQVDGEKNCDCPSKTHNGKCTVTIPGSIISIDLSN
ncbi:MAG: hypothetical protein ACEPOV_03735 [Hyphomicrobiales bacterium]